MGSQKPARRSRKRHSARKASRAAGAVRPAGPRTQPASAAPAVGARAPRRSGTETTYGQRPPSPFGGLPVSEVAIFVGLIGVIVGWLDGGNAALFAGLAVCFLGVLEVTAREHFSGYRSHTTLLAAMVAVAVETAIALVVAPKVRLALLVVVVPVFVVVFRFLRRRFTVARQARVRAFPRA